MPPAPPADRPPDRPAQPVDVSALAERIRVGEPRLGQLRLVCIDGPAGSGKSTLAAALGERLGDRCAVVHMDDLYEGWAGLATVWQRVEEQILHPLAQGRPGRWRRYDWGAERFAEWRDLPVPEYLVLEGCGSAPRAVDGRATAVVWVEAPSDLRLARGLARDGEALRGEWLRWRQDEARHFAREQVRERADVLVDGSEPVTG